MLSFFIVLLITFIICYVLYDFTLNEYVYGKAIWKDEDLSEFLLINKNNFQCNKYNHEILHYCNRGNYLNNYKLNYFSLVRKSLICKYALIIDGNRHSVYRFSPLCKVFDEVYNNIQIEYLWDEAQKKKEKYNFSDGDF